MALDFHSNYINDAKLLSCSLYHGVLVRYQRQKMVTMVTTEMTRDYSEWNPLSKSGARMVS